MTKFCFCQIMTPPKCLNLAKEYFSELGKIIKIQDKNMNRSSLRFSFCFPMMQWSKLGKMSDTWGYFVLKICVSF